MGTSPDAHVPPPLILWFVEVNLMTNKYGSRKVETIVIGGGQAGSPSAIIWRNEESLSRSSTPPAHRRRVAEPLGLAPPV